MPSGRISLRAALNSARGNHPLHWYASIFLLTNLGQGVFYGMVFLYVSSVLGLAAAFVWVLLADAVVTLAAIPLWYALVLALEKHREWALGLATAVTATMGTLFMPHAEGALPWLLFLVFLLT